MDDLWAWLAGAKGQLAISGAMGGVVRWLTLKERIGDGLVSIAVGGITATYVGPIGVPLLKPLLGVLVDDTASQGTLSGFVVGLGGITATGLFIDLWRARRKAAKEGSK